MTFDIILCYYDNPQTLHNWLARLLHHSDFLQFADQGNIIVTDTGTPRERIPATLEVLRSWQHLKRRSTCGLKRSTFGQCFRLTWRSGRAPSATT